MSRLLIKTAARKISCILLFCLLFSSCAFSAEDEKSVNPFSGSGVSSELTAEFREFLSFKSKEKNTVREDIAEGFKYSLHGGCLRFINESGEEVWRSGESWYVDDFRLGDVDGDGVSDCLFSLWKSYSYAESYRERMKDDPSVKNHLFLYTIRSETAKALWCSSNLPRPIYSFELDQNGQKTPVSSGMLLKTKEGEYRDDFSKSEESDFEYKWQGWGFVEE